MKLARTIVLGALAWVLVVAAGSTLVWTVISRAGDEVVSAREPVPGPTRSTLTKPSAATSASDPAGRPSRHPSGPSDPADPTSPTGPTGPTSGPVSPSSPSGPTAERRTWQGPGGLVVAECRGATVSLVAAQPDTGYAVNVGERGPEKLEVEFEGREDDAGRHSHVVARCVGGVPQFSAVSEDSGGGGDG